MQNITIGRPNKDQIDVCHVWQPLSLWSTSIKRPPPAADSSAICHEPGSSENLEVRIGINLWTIEYDIIFVDLLPFKSWKSSIYMLIACMQIIPKRNDKDSDIHDTDKLNKWYLFFKWVQIWLWIYFVAAGQETNITVRCTLLSDSNH